MNLDIFNRVNTKDSGTFGMYSDWASLSPAVHEFREDRQSVLDTLPGEAGRDVVTTVVKQLAAHLGIKQAPEPSPLKSDKEVQWTMEVICYGLTLPISDHDTVRDCVSIYCEWLSALNPPAKISVPKSICDDPNLYARRIIGHLHNLFVPRKGEAQDTISRQAVLCHRVLRTLQEVAELSTILTRETWQALLLFLIAINDTLLAPPSAKDDVGDLLCERVLSVLVEVWLVACVRCFPSPPLWRTLREMSLNWRHRIALVEQWNRVHLALTARLLEYTYGPDFPQLKINEEDKELLPAGMTHDCVAQCWYRFLHCIGNPVDLSRPGVISQTPKFLQYALSGNIDPSQHPCLATLPQIFLKAVRGIAGQVDAFLGIASSNLYEEVTGEKKEKEVALQPTPPPQRRLAKSFSVTPSAVTKGLQKGALMGLTSSRLSTIQPPVLNSGPSSTSSAGSGTLGGSEPRAALAPDRPKCNSILHLFGAWLFEAASLGHDVIVATPGRTSKVSREVLLDTRRSVTSSQPSSLSEEEMTEGVGVQVKYEAGRAEALGALCRLLTAKKTGEEILPVYLARFYVSLQQGLQIPETRDCSDVMAAILLNSPDLFRIDLDGVLTLLPAFTSALEIIFPDQRQRSSAAGKTELRHACIHILLSVTALPLHFQNLPIRELWPSTSDHLPMTVGSLRSRLMTLLVDALQMETDGMNAQMLLGGLLLAVLDSNALEEGDTVTQPDSASNIFSSAGSDTLSTRSLATSDRRSLGGDSTEYSESVYDTAHGLYVKTTCLVCHRLISSWLSDMNVSLAALELLSGLARVQVRETDGMEPKRTVSWLCDYIIGQCKKPPPAHSKDLHSTIVAAFHCCATWLVQHPAVLEDRKSLTTVLQVVELGISGSISQGKPGEPLKMKDEKELKPVSMRVKDAAESLLHTILEQVGCFPSPCGPESLSSLLDEVSLLKHCHSWPGGDTDRVTACQKFKYFVLDNTILLALLEEPLGNDQDPQPTVTVIVRGPFGRQVWTMQLRHLPRHKSGTKHQHSNNPGRPVPLTDVVFSPELPTQHFPDSVDLIPPCRADRSIPSLDSLISDDKTSAQHQRLRGLIEKQAEMEEAMRRVGISRETCLVFPDPSRECVPPTHCHEFQTARLFLSNFGLLAIDSDKEDENSLTVLDTSMPGFCSELDALDMLSPRTCDTVHAFYVRSGQKTCTEILMNAVAEGATDAAFVEMLSTLGWPVNVFQHPGWTGHISTSHKLQPFPDSQNASMSEGSPSLYNGEKYVLYWSDVAAEVAFIVPNTRTRKTSEADVAQDPQLAGQAWYERSVSVGATHRENVQKTRAMSLDLDKVTAEPTRPGRKAGALKSTPFPDPPTKVLLVWLESYEDSLIFPTGDLLPYCSTGLENGAPRAEDAYVIYLHALSCGLVRVKLVGPKTPVSIPLVDGMVVSRRALGPLVRQTSLNICKRRRLDNDSYHPPHVRRRLKVQEFASRYQKNINAPELLSYLFTET